MEEVTSGTVSGLLSMETGEETESSGARRQRTDEVGLTPNAAWYS
jgi:hypothetical protein